MFIAVLCHLVLLIGSHTSAESVPLGTPWLPSIHRRVDPSSGVNYNPNGSAFLWLPQDTYAGKTFLELVDPFFNNLILKLVISSGFDFWSAADPTGYVSVH